MAAGWQKPVDVNVQKLESSRHRNSRRECNLSRAFGRWPELPRRQLPARDGCKRQKLSTVPGIAVVTLRAAFLHWAVRAIRQVARVSVGLRLQPSVPVQ